MAEYAKLGGRERERERDTVQGGGASILGLLQPHLPQAR